jgi:hypothetical protein
MSGNIKVSGTWRNASNLYVRVGGTWRTALQAYINVGGSWRIWYNTTISDTFTRANTTTGLGSTESGGVLPWNSLIGNFFVSSGTARSDNAVTAGNAGALSYITLNTSNATAAVGGQTTTAGIGPAVWVSAAGSWWAAIGSNGQTNTTYTYNCNCTCNGHTVCNTCSNAAFGTYSATAYYSPAKYDEWKVYTNSTTYSNSGSTPQTSSNTTYAYSSAAQGYPATIATRFCTAANGADPGNSCPYSWEGYCRSDATGSICSYTCPNGGELSSSTCRYCPAGDVNGNVCCNASVVACYTPTTTTTTTCATGTYYASPPSGCTSGCCTSSTISTWSGCSNGFVFSDSCYYCGNNSFGFVSNNQGQYGYFCYYNYNYYGTGTDCAICGSTFYSGGTANPSTGAGCDSYGFTCQTCTGGSITTNYYMQLIKATSTGAPYTVLSTSADYGAQISNISITTSGNTLTATAYGTTGSSLGTLTTTNTATTKPTGVGIVKGHSPYNQASTGDNFSAIAGALTYVPVEYLVIGGGAGGGGRGGGGAGGVLAGSFNLNSDTPQTITIGAGGLPSNNGTPTGGNTVFGSFTAVGGSASYSSIDGGAAASGTAGQGFAGGLGGTGAPSNYVSGGGGGGGGGAGVNGQSGWPAFIGGHGGLAYQSSITGTATYYAGGGGGFGESNGGVGGIGGTQTPGGSPPSNYGGQIETSTYATRKAGAGSGGRWWNGTDWISSAQSADANTGSGGGGGGAVYGAGSGGSGIVILAYANTYPDLVIAGLPYTLSTTSRPGYKVYKFTGGSGTVQFNLSGASIAEYLVVAGGGGGGTINATAGGYAGSGGAGGLLVGSIALPIGASIPVTVGAGGASRGGTNGSLGGQQVGSNGGNSVLGTVTAIGGGGGGIGSYPGVAGGSQQDGVSGGSGGGAGPGGTPGSGTTGQGTAGGGGGFGGGYGGYGGGAGGSGGYPFNGGPGLSYSTTGSAVTYAAGGKTAIAASGSATPNTGNGGAGNTYSYQGGNFAGASGVVVLAYPNTYPALTTIPAGLTYTYSTTSRTGYRVYTFTDGTGTVIV